MATKKTEEPEQALEPQVPGIDWNLVIQRIQVLDPNLFHRAVAEVQNQTLVAQIQAMREEADA